MALVFTESTPQDSNRGGVALASGWYLFTGTLTFSGSYATGGDTLDVSAKSSIGSRMREAIPLADVRGNSMEFDVANKKLKLFSSANTELTAAAYNAALTATPVPVAFLVRIG